MKCREKLRRRGSPHPHPHPARTCLGAPQNQMVSTLFSPYPTPPSSSIYRLFIVANEIKWNPCYQPGTLSNLPWSPAPSALGALLRPWTWGPQFESSRPPPRHKPHTHTHSRPLPRLQRAVIRRPGSHLQLRVVVLTWASCSENNPHSWQF